MKPIIVATRKCRDYVKTRTPFKNHSGSLTGVAHTDGRYVVYSYHTWPLFIFDPELGGWIANTDKVSATTSQHYSYAHPHTMVMIEVNHELATVAAEYGYVEMAKRRLGLTGEAA